MKKYIIVVLALIFVFNAHSQQQPVFKNRRGINVHPQGGEIALGFGTNSIFRYIGNMFNNNSSNNAPTSEYPNFQQAVFAKYMIDNNTALRATLGMGLVSTKNIQQVPDLSPGASSDSKVSNKTITKYNTFTLSTGIEKRRGNNRFQGIYGGEFMIGVSNGSNTTTEYGNSIDLLPLGTTRLLEQNGASSFTLGLRAFAGIEYFIAPKLSLGAEFGFGPSVTFFGKQSTTLESYDNIAGQAVKTENVNQKSARTFYFGTDNNAGLLKLQFYF